MTLICNLHACTLATTSQIRFSFTTGASERKAAWLYLKKTIGPVPNVMRLDSSVKSFDFLKSDFSRI